MDLLEIGKKLDQIREREGVFVAFETLQDIITALTLRSQRSQAIGGPLPSRFLDWYIRQLAALDKEITGLINEEERIGFQPKVGDPKRTAANRIRAILDSLPETSRVLEAAAKQ